MPKHYIRAWATQTLYDCRDYEVEAATPEAAAAKVRDIMARIGMRGNAIWIDLRTGEEHTGDRLENADRPFVVRELDPAEVTDSEEGFCSYDPESGWRLDEIEPTEAEDAA